MALFLLTAMLILVVIGVLIYNLMARMKPSIGLGRATAVAGLGSYV